MTLRREPGAPRRSYIVTVREGQRSGEVSFPLALGEHGWEVKGYGAIGSQAVLKERASAQQYPYTIAARTKLIEDGTLVKDGEHLTFTRDAEFTSPSAAATVVHGGSANGLLAWKTRDGKTLKELEAV